MVAMPSVLLIEDHRDIAEMIVGYLETKNYTVDYANDGITGLHLAVTNQYDLLILDLSLPGLDGLELCRQFRESAKNDTPVIMLTARDTIDEKIKGLDAGADDYLVKPFAINELEARMRALIRRNQSNVVKETLQLGPLSFNRATLEVTREDTQIQLTPIGIKILEVLMRASPAVVSRSEIERKIWGDMLPDSDALRSHIYSLRKKIDKPFAFAMIKNLPGNGYQMLAEQEEQSQEHRA